MELLCGSQSSQWRCCRRRREANKRSYTFKLQFRNNIKISIITRVCHPGLKNSLIHCLRFNRPCPLPLDPLGPFYQCRLHLADLSSTSLVLFEDLLSVLQQLANWGERNWKKVKILASFHWHPCFSFKIELHLKEQGWTGITFGSSRTGVNNSIPKVRERDGNKKTFPGTGREWEKPFP